MVIKLLPVLKTRTIRIQIRYHTFFLVVTQSSTLLAELLYINVKNLFTEPPVIMTLCGLRVNRENFSATTPFHDKELHFHRYA